MSLAVLFVPDGTMFYVLSLELAPFMIVSAASESRQHPTAYILLFRRSDQIESFSTTQCISKDRLFDLSDLHFETWPH
jgi:hypothetical protein